MIYFISDTHFNHRNIIRYTSRINIYDEVNYMNEDMITRWNSVVKPDDIVYHLGDFAFGSKEVVKEIVRRLNGKIRLVLGNHDKRNKPQWYEGLGFDRIYDTPIILDYWFILSHEPIAYLTEVMPYGNIHGHTHDECFSNPQRFNVCWEISKGYPVAFDDIKAYFAELSKAKETINYLNRQRHDGESMDYNEGYANGYIDGIKRNKKLK